MTVPALGDFSPIRLSWDGGAPVVDWCHTAGTVFGDPFFDQTVERLLRHPFRLLFRPATSMAELVAEAERRPGLAPSGFVFHLSRCGSTLLAQMFAARGDTRVMSEPGPVDSVVRAPVDVEQRVRWLRAMVSVLGRPAAGERHYVVKLDSWAMLALPLIRQAFPDVPWVFLHRDPVEILASQSGHRGYHMVPGSLPPEWFGLSPAVLPAMSLEEYGAAVLARIVRCALAAVGDPLGMFVDYRELPRVAVDRVARHFGVPVSDEHRRAMLGAAARDAKNPVLEFVDDRERKQRYAGDQLRDAVERLTMPAYRELLAQAGEAA